ncbi:hypothetical protein D3093_35445 (plasmid) [Azospirillum argentinense]|uniref:Uncharacterized protein n=1 Tax=Azospirillum argentinense TaxID=2970906 RepID=A0A4D8PT77_9PROT|nr:hypothetical protein [Azospirillum argentinense]QCO00541.1 hypothetical protein D3093_35445 [Azospirillum argentinense]
MTSSHEINRHELAPAQDALNLMRRAYERKTGCHLTAEMIAALNTTLIGEMWSEPDPRDSKPEED